MLIIIGLLTLFPYLFNFNVGYNYNAFDLLPEIPSVLRQKELIKEMDMSFEYSIISTSDIGETRAVYDSLKNNKRYSLVDSIAELIPEDQESRIESVKRYLTDNPFVLEYLPVLKEFYSNNRQNINLSETESDLMLFWGQLSNNLLEMYDNKVINLGTLPDNMKNKYLGVDGSIATFAFGQPDMWGEEEMKKTVSELREINVNSTGTPFMWVKLVDYIKSDLIRSSIVVFLTILIIITIVFRKPKYILIVMSPVVIGFLLLLGLMSLFKISFNAANITAFPLILGIAVDDGIHMVKSYLSDESRSISSMISKSGKAVLVTSLTTMIGFGSLYFVFDPLVSSLGVLLFFGTLFSLVASLTIVPLLLMFMDKSR